MLDDASSVSADSTATARSRVQNGQTPDWVNKCSYDAEFKSANETPITYLLFDTQIHAEQQEAFIHQAIRLETMEAVQHWSQWRLQFEPKTQVITLHSLKIRRGVTEIDQSNLEKAHLLQREEGLERFIIHGWFTLLMVLEDVRPGDILEFSYTIKASSSLFPNLGGYFFTLPQGVSVGKYHFAVRFNSTRQRKWKASAPDLKPVETQENGMTFWEWSGEKYVGSKPEINTPSWHISYPWIQVSDFPNWQMIAAELSKVWTIENAEEAVAEMARELEGAEADLPSRIDKAIRFVQDECRYLSVNLELGGQIPTSPEIVARRRFGDCKDLSFLLANILKKLGAQARPVLVHTFLRKSIADFLPMPSLFNHVVVEFEVDEKRRWIDTTFKEQGGGAFNRFIPGYALGLPIDANADGLDTPPQIQEESHLFDLREHVLLDTSNAPSLMEVTLCAEGNQADILRFQLKKSGMEEMAKQRLQAVVSRFGNANRIGLIQYRDDRATNRFVLVEVFEIKFFLGSHPNPKFCRVNLPGHWLARVLTMPEKKERRAPFVLPYPCRISYVADMECHAIQRMKLSEPRFDASNGFVQFNRTDKTGNGYILMKCSLATNAESVPAEQVQKHGEVVEKIGRACCREISLLRGYSRSRPKSDFGQLPPAGRKPSPELQATTRELLSARPAQTTTVRHRRRGQMKISRRLVWIICIIVFYLLLGLLKLLSQ
jgi:hypothetical protein